MNHVESAVRSYIPPKPKHDNISKSDCSALYNLQKREDIVIKSADKGSAVVFMDQDHYVSEAERQLNDSTFYKPLNHDPTPEFTKQVSDAVRVMHDQGLISKKNMAYLIVDQHKAGRFYLLQEIHKTGNQGRSIVSANGHPTEKISEFVFASTVSCPDFTIIPSGYHIFPEEAGGSWTHSISCFTCFHG